MGIMVMVLLCLIKSVPASPYYVVPSALGGNDANNGAIDKPWATTAKAFSTAVAGDTVYFRAGTYARPGVDPKSGTLGKPTTFMAYPGESVLIDGGTQNICSLSGKSFITFDHLCFTTANVNVGAHMFYCEGTGHVSFTGCEFYGMPAEVGAENSSVIRCMATGWPDTAGLVNSDSCVFRNNYFHDNASPALRLYDTKGWIIENNTFVNCIQAVGGKDEAYSMLVRRNLVVGGDLAFYFAMQGGSNGVDITENIVVKTTRVFMIGGLGTGGRMRQNVHVYNNTFYNCATMIIGWDDGYNTAVKFWNNIFYSDTSLNIASGADCAARFITMDRWGGTEMAVANYSFSNDCYQIPTADKSAYFIDAGHIFNSLAAWQSAKPGFEASTLWDSPRFVTAGSDYHLQVGSFCIGTGLGGVDLGAYPRGNDGTVIGIIGNATPIIQVLPNRTATVRPIVTAVGANCTFDILGRRITAGPLIPPAGIMIGKDGKISLGIR
jgi:parallel beta-helix repeat protein